MASVFCVCILSALIAPAEIIDRVAVSIGNHVITRSEIDLQIRLTAFLNGEAPDFSSASKRKTADRLVEQTVVRNDLQLSGYPGPPQSEADAMLQDLKKTRFPNEAQFQQVLRKYEITAEDLRKQLWWQLTFLRFVDVRFRPGIQITDQEIRDYFEKEVRPTALREHPGQPVSLEDYRDRIEEILTAQRVDQELDQWLELTRKRTRIEYHAEAFQ